MGARYDNIGGVQHKVSKRYDNINGIFRPVSKRFSNIAGVWRQSYNARDGVAHNLDGSISATGALAFWNDWGGTSYISNGHASRSLFYITLDEPISYTPLTKIGTINNLTLNISGQSGYLFIGFLYFHAGTAAPVYGAKGFAGTEYFQGTVSSLDITTGSGQSGTLQTFLVELWIYNRDTYSKNLEIVDFSTLAGGITIGGKQIQSLELI